MTAEPIGLEPMGIQSGMYFAQATHIIEWLNKEFRRRTKIMVIVAGEIARYRIQAYIFFKMLTHGG
jgi:hypothetical protein